VSSTSESHPSPVISSSLDRLKPGRCGTVREVQAGEEEIDRLKAMGICQGRKVMLVRAGDPLILRVLGSRIGLSARLAARVSVSACADHFCGGELV
jgi:Fe2+ transport system protein FeoA